MERKNHVNEILNSVAGIQKARAPHDGFAKIQQRLANQRNQQALTNQRSGYGWMKVAAVISLVVCSNIWAVSNYLRAESQSSDGSGGYSQLVTDFNLYDNE